MSTPFAILFRVASSIPETAVSCGHSAGVMYPPRRRIQ